ncbi:MAG: SH3 domain-containing protein [Pseudomonadota bacterium]
MIRVMVGVLFMGGVLMSAPAFSEVADGANAPRISHISGKPVPRFESLRYDRVNGRAGPSLEHPIRWHYERAGLPVMILKETEGWRFVRDPDGDEVWLHERMLSPVQTAVIKDTTLMRAEPQTEGRALARLREGVQVEILEYSGGFIRVGSGRFRGWIHSDAIWGQTAS